MIPIPERVQNQLIKFARDCWQEMQEKECEHSGGSARDANMSCRCYIYHNGCFCFDILCYDSLRGDYNNTYLNLEYLLEEDRLVRTWFCGSESSYAAGRREISESEVAGVILQYLPEIKKQMKACMEPEVAPVKTERPQGDPDDIKW